MPQSPSPPVHPPSRSVRPRSTHELRLEQIAIWGDAAEYSSRASSIKRNSSWRPSSSRTSNTNTNNASNNYNSFTKTLPSTSASPASPSRNNNNSNSNQSRRRAQPIDIDQLTQSVNNIPVRRGSMSLCNSRSAEAFRRSGTFAIRAAKSHQRHNQNTSENINFEPNLPDIERVDVEADHFVLTKRSSVASTPTYLKLSNEQNDVQDVEEEEESDKNKHMNKNVKNPSNSRMSRFFGINNNNTNTDQQQQERQSLFGKSLFPLSNTSSSSSNTSSPPPNNTRRRERQQRDENDFRFSNAKLPERDDDHSPSLFSSLRLRPRNLPTNSIGRYSRSRMSRLPNPPLTARPVTPSV